MTQFNQADVVTTIATAQTFAGGSRNHDIDVGAYDNVAIQLDWASLAVWDNSFTILASADGSTFEEYTGASYTPGVAAGTHLWNIHTDAFLSLRIAYTKGTAAAGTYALKSRVEVPN